MAVFTVTFTHSFDSIAQAERGGCAKCGPKVCDKVRSPHTHPRTSRVYRYDCLISQFTVIHTCADTHDPEVMAVSLFLFSYMGNSMSDDVFFKLTVLLDMRLQVRLAPDHGEVAAGKRGGRTRGSRAVRAHARRAGRAGRGAI